MSLDGLLLYYWFMRLLVPTAGSTLVSRPLYLPLLQPQHHSNAGHPGQSDFLAHPKSTPQVQHALGSPSSYIIAVEQAQFLGVLGTRAFALVLARMCQISNQHI